MNWKKIGLALLYPHMVIIICLLPISVAFLVFSLIYLGTESIIAIISYLLAFYVLFVICFRIPSLINWFSVFKKENRYMKKWLSDVHLRLNVSLYGSLIWNIIFAIFQLGLGFYHKSFWFCCMFAYYVILGVIKFFILKHTIKYKANEQAILEIKKYIICGLLLLFMNLALAVIVFFIVYLNQTFNHDMITTIAMATFTFLTFTFAIINLIKYRKYKSPIYSASKNISLISTTVSMLTLETTMLTTFGDACNTMFRLIIISATGIAVIGFAVTISVIMIYKGNKKLKNSI